LFDRELSPQLKSWHQSTDSKKAFLEIASAVCLFDAIDFVVALEEYLSLPCRFRLSTGPVLCLSVFLSFSVCLSVLSFFERYFAFNIAITERNKERAHPNSRTQKEEEKMKNTLFNVIVYKVQKTKNTLWEVKNRFK
jgi:hypothetical protein